MRKLSCLIIAAICCVFFTSTAQAVDLPITSPFGWRIHPITGTWKFHSGIDIGFDYGTPVNVVMYGQVMMAGDYGDGYGNQVLVYHPLNDTYTRYGHMCQVIVGVGDVIDAGTIIGYVGSTGNSTGPHLHLEYIVPDGSGGYVYADPLSLWGE